MRSKFGSFHRKMNRNRNRIVTAKKKRLLESGQVCGHHLWLFNIGGLVSNPHNIAAYSFERVNESQTWTVNHRRSMVHKGQG